MAQRELPSEWLYSQLGEIIPYGKTQKCVLADVTDDTWVLELEDVEKNSSRILSRKTAKDRPFKSSKNRFEKGHVLYGKLRPYLNKVVVADHPGVCTTEIIPLDAEPFVLNRYLFHWLKTRDFLNYVNEVSYGVNMPRLGTKDGVAAPFVLAPLAEQKVIANKLDILLTQAENTKARLERIPQILKRFRQSILAAAVSGRLTEDWRTENQLIVSPDYRSECMKQRLSVDTKKKVKIVGLTDLPEIDLPTSWWWQSIDETCLKITDGTHHSPKSYPSGEYMYVTSKNVREGYIDLTNITYVDAKTHKEIYKRCDVKKGDVLYIKDGANTGLACVNNIKEEISLLSSVGVMKVCDFINPTYLQHYLNSPIGRKLMLDLMGGTAIKRLTLNKIAISPVSVPPIEEQTEIVRRVDQLFAYADRIEQQVNNSLARVNNFTQSILAKAFRGELTEQWRKEHPDLITGDNSAAALLARIKAEKSKQVVKSKRKAEAV